MFDISSLSPRAARAPGERHRRRRQSRPAARRPDPALGRGGRPADAALHRRGGDPFAAGRRDLLHLAARHPGTARRPGELLRALLPRAPSRRRMFFVTGSGMQAIKLSIEAVTSPGDEVLYLLAGLAQFPRGRRHRRRRGQARAASSTRRAAGRWTSPASRRRSPRGRAASSSTRRRTRPAGRQAWTSSARSSESPAGTGSGS